MSFCIVGYPTGMSLFIAHAQRVLCLEQLADVQTGYYYVARDS